MLRKHHAANGLVNVDQLAIGHDELCGCCNGGRLLPAGCFEAAIMTTPAPPNTPAGAAARASTSERPGARPVSEARILNGVVIDDTFAEAFPMKATRILITAHNLTWARHAAVSATGFATSVIACGCEAGIERELGPDDTPDGRPGLLGADLLDVGQGAREAGRAPRRPVRADLSDHGGVRRLASAGNGEPKAR